MKIMPWLMSIGLIFSTMFCGAETQITDNLYHINVDELRSLVESDKEANRIFKEIKVQADLALQVAPNPVDTIFYEGLIDADPRRVRTKESLKDALRAENLAWTYLVTREKKYADKVREIVFAWSQKHIPNGNPISEKELIPMISAYGLLIHHFSDVEKAGIDRWLHNIASLEMLGKKDNNWQAKRLWLVGFIGFILEEPQYIEYVQYGYKKYVDIAFYADGKTNDFIQRDAFNYHAGGIRPLIDLAIAADRNGMDLESYQNADGGALRKCIDFMVPYTNGEKQHEEFVNSKVEFDHIRAEAGEAKYAGGNIYDGMGAARVYEYYSYFDDSYLSLAYQIKALEVERFSTWKTVLNHVLVDSPGMPVRQASFDLKIEQVTSGTKHHFFGYIGQCQTIPWNATGQYILGLEIDRIDRMPAPKEAATIILIDTYDNNRIIPVDKTHAWNPQQGTMFYWNPLAAESQFFFNDRDVETGEVFTVIYDVNKKKRVREFRFEDTPIGNGGVAADGSAWFGLNYGRLARLRLVTGYPEALDWSKEDVAPKHDGIFIVDINTGEKRLLVSYHQLEEKLLELKPGMKHSGLFINHTLWNRDADRIYFFVRSGWGDKPGDKINVPCSINIDGTGLTLHETHIGGHPEWAEGNLLIGIEKPRDGSGDRQILYNVDTKKIVGQLGNPEMFPKPEGDISLSPDGNWFVNGYKESTKNYYAVFRRNDGAFARSEGIDKGSYSGDIRIDPAPRWNRTNDAILVPGLAGNHTRQMFIIRIIDLVDP